MCIDIIKDTIFYGKQIDELYNLVSNYKDIYLVFDSNISLEFIKEISAVVKPRSIMSIDVSEDGKNIDTVMNICSWLIDNKADRYSLLIGCGGGITTDIVGFAASIYKRKIDFGFIPTTLLAQVDASIGGKNGVNFNGYKNMIGTITQPRFTFIYPKVLSQLPLDIFKDGASELLKTFIINNDDNNYEKAIAALSMFEQSKIYTDSLNSLIYSAAMIKADIVQKDKFDKGERQKLNLGHTFAHAIEWKSAKLNTTISHGRAVAIGICIILEISYRLGLCSKMLISKITEDFKLCDLPTKSPYKMDELLDAIMEDKKIISNTINLILIKNIGDVVIQPIEIDQLKKLLK